MDRNRDGVLDDGEMPSVLRDTLYLWDLNENGVIDQDEFEIFRGAYENQQISMASNETSALSPKKDNSLLSYDKNHDGQISLYEWRIGGGNLQEFEMRDKNNDGFLEGKELGIAGSVVGNRVKNEGGAKTTRMKTGRPRSK